MTDITGCYTLEHLFNGFFNAFNFDFFSRHHDGIIVFCRDASDAEIGFEFGFCTRRTERNPRAIGQIESQHILFWQVNHGRDGGVGEFSRFEIQQIADGVDIDAGDGMRWIVSQLRQDISHRFFARKPFVESFSGIFDVNAEFEIDFV